MHAAFSHANDEDAVGFAHKRDSLEKMG